MAHNEFAKVFVLVTNKALVIENGALFESVSIFWWATSDDLANKTRLVHSSFRIITYDVHCGVVCVFNIVVIRRTVVIGVVRGYVLSIERMDCSRGSTKGWFLIQSISAIIN